MIRPALVISTMVLIGALGCGGRNTSAVGTSSAETVEASMFEDVGDEAMPVDAAMDVAMAGWTHCQINAQCPSGQVCFVENDFACGDARGDGVCVTRLANTCTGYGCPCLKLIPPYYCGQGPDMGCWGGDLRGQVTDASTADPSQCWICHEPQ